MDRTLQRALWSAGFSLLLKTNVHAKACGPQCRL